MNNRSQLDYELIGRPSTNLANSVTTASLTLKKKNSYFDKALISFEYVISLTANKSNFDTFTIILDTEEVLRLASSINELRIQKDKSKQKTFTIASRNNNKNLTIQTIERSSTSGTDVAKAYFNHSKDIYFYLNLNGHTISVLYAKCIELLCLSNSCNPLDLFVYYPSLQRKIQRG